MSKYYVLVTAKFHPASKALHIIAELVVGVAEARPNGFSNLRPHISTLTSTSSIGVKNFGSSGSVLPICLTSIVLSNSSTCPLLNTSAQRELVGKTLQSYYPDGPPCSCGGAGGWTRAAYLNMSDPNQQCPSNWTLVTTPIRGCGRRARSYGVCDLVTYSVHGRTYSSVCGRILAYQRGVA